MRHTRLASKIGTNAGMAYRSRGTSLPTGGRRRSAFRKQPSFRTIAVGSLADAMELLRKLLRMPVISYAAGIFVVAGSLFLAYHLQTFLEKSSLFVVLAGVVFSAWLGGLEVGLTCLALGVLGTKFFLLPPIWSFRTAITSDLIRLGCFLLVGGEAVWLIAKNHRPFWLDEKRPARELAELAPVIAITSPSLHSEESVPVEQEAAAPVHQEAAALVQEQAQTPLKEDAPASVWQEMSIPLSSEDPSPAHQPHAPALLPQEPPAQEAPVVAKLPTQSMEWIPDAVIMFDAEWRCTDLNEKAAALWHEAKAELRGKSLGDLLPEGINDSLYLECIRAGNDQVARRFEYRDARTDRWFAGYTSAVDTGVAVYLRDITAAKRAEEMVSTPQVAPPQEHTDEVAAIKQTFVSRIQELEQANVELERLSYAVFDDLQEPLRTAIMCLDLLKKHGDGTLDSAASTYLSSALNGAQLTQARMQDLISYSEIGTREKRVELVDCEKLLDLTIRKMKEAIERSEVVITYAMLPTIQGSPAQLAQVFENLIDNSIKFRSESGPYVHISAERQGHEWLFSVKDNGIGIEAQYLEHVFMLFRRLPTAAEYPGTGMGLAVCKKIIQRHGGRIWAESQTGKGATFYFTIPEETHIVRREESHLAV